MEEHLKKALSFVVLLFAALFSLNAYSIGDIGPSGGIVIYDKESYSNGWRFIESAPEPIDGLYYLEYYGIEGTMSEIGYGMNNTVLIASEFEQSDNAAFACLNLSIGNTSNWHLPSIDELKLVFKTFGKLNVSTAQTTVFCSSSEACDPSDDAGYSWLMDFSNGLVFNARRNSSYRVWPVRYF